MERGSTFFLRGVVFLIGVIVLALCILLGYQVLTGEMNPESAYLQYLFLFGLYATTIPFFFALYQTLKLLSYIDKNKAFSELSVKALKNIKYCATTISILYATTVMPFILHVAQEDDAPGLGALGLVITLAPIVVAVFAAVLQKLLKNAIDIKSENDLTV